MKRQLLVSVLWLASLTSGWLVGCKQSPSGTPTALDTPVPCVTASGTMMPGVSSWLPTPTRATSPLSQPTPQVKTIPPKPTQTRQVATPASKHLFLPLIVRAPTVVAAVAATATATPTRRPRPTARIPNVLIPVNLGGLHVEGVGDHTGYEELLQACSTANRPIALIKVYGDGYSAKIAKTIDPRTITIWRKPAKLGKGEDADNPLGDWNWPAEEAAARAQWWMKAMYPVWDNERKYIDYFEIVNEPNPSTVTQTLRSTEFMIEAMKEADRHDPPYKLAIWSFSSGTPEPWQAKIMLPSLQYAVEHGHILSVHDGSVDAVRPLFQQAYKDGTAFRYRMFESMLKTMPKVAVTEAYQPGGYWTPDWEDWQWYLTEMSKDKYALGAAWFTLGIYSFDGIEDVNVVEQLPDFARALGCVR